VNLAVFKNMAFKLAIIAFPSDGGKGGGLSLLAGMVPHVARRGGRVMWIDELYDSDRERIAALKVAGAAINQARRPRRRLLRWLDSLLQRPPESVQELATFRPHVVIAAVGMHAPEAEESWRLKKAMTDAARAVGAKIVMQHQYASGGEWVVDSGVSGEWLDWQRAADWHQWVSARTRSEIEENFGFAMPGEIIRNNYHVPYDGELSWPEDKVLRMAFVGRFRIWQKGLDLLVDAASQLASTHPDGWGLELVGGGEMTARLEAEVRRRGLSERISIVAHVDDIHAFWRSRHLLVMPSRAEGLSLALTEAMLCGRPVVASMAAGTGDLLEEGVTGLSCYLDAGHLAQRMRDAIALHGRGLLGNLGRAAAVKARQVFPANSEEVYLDQLTAFLASQHCSAGK
jgi:glycosyltransferase involved in cell wall biosynthesis